MSRDGPQFSRRPLQRGIGIASHAKPCNRLKRRTLHRAARDRTRERRASGEVFVGEEASHVARNPNALGSIRHVLLQSHYRPGNVPLTGLLQQSLARIASGGVLTWGNVRPGHRGHRGLANGREAALSAAAVASRRAQRNCETDR